MDATHQDAIAELGEHLRRIGYDEQGIGRRLGRVPARLVPSTVAVAERRAGDDELGLAIRLWNLGQVLSAPAAQHALGDVRVAPLVEAGLLVEVGPGVRAQLRLSPALGRLHAHDFDRGGGLDRDHVVGVGPAALTLSGITPRRHVERALDLGTGCGVQAFGLVRHASTVVATDISLRAAWTARVGAALGGIERLEVRTEDALEPVADEGFDLVVCNPPFVVSPSNELTYRDGDQAGDERSRRFVLESVARLGPGGVACVLTNWIVTHGVQATDIPRSWLDGIEADVLLLHHEELDPVAYAERWALLPEGIDADASRVEIGRWTDELERLGASAVASGALVIKRTDAPARWRVARMRKRPVAGGPQVQRMLDALGRFTGPEDPGLATTAFGLVEGHRVEQRLHYGSSAYAPGLATLRLDRSAGVLATVPADLLEALFLIDGRRDLMTVARELSETRGSSTEKTMRALMPLALELYELGFLEVAS